MSSKKPLTIASNQGSMGGGEVMLLQIAELARSLGRDVTVVAPRSPSGVIDEATQRGFRTVAIHGQNTREYLVNLRRWDASERRGLLWCNGLRPAFATSGHRQRVVHLHQRPTGVQKLYELSARIGAQATIVPSESMRKAIPQAWVMPNWCPQPDVTRPVFTATPYSDKPITLGFLGRLSVDKGILTLLEALRLLDDQNPGRYRLIVAGESRFVDPDEADQIRRALDAMGDLVDVRGWMDRAEFFSQVDLAIFPSQVSESFGLVAAEAMASRCPVLVSDAGALPDVVGPDYLGVFPAGNPTRLAEMVTVAGKIEWHNRAEVLYQRWERLYSPEAGQQHLADIFARLDGGVDIA